MRDAPSARDVRRMALILCLWNLPAGCGRTARDDALLRRSEVLLPEPAGGVASAELAEAKGE